MKYLIMSTPLTKKNVLIFFIKLFNLNYFKNDLFIKFILYFVSK